MKKLLIFILCCSLLFLFVPPIQASQDASEALLQEIKVIVKDMSKEVNCMQIQMARLSTAQEERYAAWEKATDQIEENSRQINHLTEIIGEVKSAWKTYFTAVIAGGGLLLSLGAYIFRASILNCSQRVSGGG